MTRNPIPLLRDLSKTNLAVVVAFQKGYKVVDGVPYSPSGRRLKTTYQHPVKYRRHRFSVKIDSESRKVYVHKLVAFQKYGLAAFQEGIHVRHLDGDPENNRDENIAIGTGSENMMDRPPSARIKSAIEAASYRRKISDADTATARRLRAAGWSYKGLMKKYGIKSKGTMHHILHNKYQTVADR